MLHVFALEPSGNAPLSRKTFFAWGTTRDQILPVPHHNSGNDNFVTILVGWFLHMETLYQKPPPNSSAAETEDKKYGRREEEKNGRHGRRDRGYGKALSTLAPTASAARAFRMTSGYSTRSTSLIRSWSVSLVSPGRTRTGSWATIGPVSTFSIAM